MPEVRSGTKVIYELQPGERWCYYKNKIIVTHPDRPPKEIDINGREVDIKPYGSK